MRHLPAQTCVTDAENPDIFNATLRILVQMANISDRVLRGSPGGAM